MNAYSIINESLLNDKWMMNKCLLNDEWIPAE